MCQNRAYLLLMEYLFYCQACLPSCSFFPSYLINLQCVMAPHDSFNSGLTHSAAHQPMGFILHTNDQYWTPYTSRQRAAAAVERRSVYLCDLGCSVYFLYIEDDAVVYVYDVYFMRQEACMTIICCHCLLCALFLCSCFHSLVQEIAHIITLIYCIHRLYKNKYKYRLL